ncbi:unnamed protein product [Effrenium voratum]|nr:unnamed protein product [Effrenium voratum]
MRKNPCRTRSRLSEGRLQKLRRIRRKAHKTWQGDCRKVPTSCKRPGKLCKLPLMRKKPCRTRSRKSEGRLQKLTCIRRKAHKTWQGDCRKVPTSCKRPGKLCKLPLMRKNPCRTRSRRSEGRLQKLSEGRLQKLRCICSKARETLEGNCRRQQDARSQELEALQARDADHGRKLQAKDEHLLELQRAQAQQAEHHLELEEALQEQDEHHTNKAEAQLAEHRLELERILQAKDAEHSENLQVEAAHRLELEQALQEHHQQQSSKLEAKDAEHSEKFQAQQAEHRLVLEQALQEHHQQQTNKLEAKDAEHSEKLQVQQAEHRLVLEQALQEHHQQQTNKLEAKDAEHSEKLQVQQAEHRLVLEQALQEHHQQQTTKLEAKHADHTEKLQVLQAEHRLELEEALQEHHQQQTNKLEEHHQQQTRMLEARDAEHCEKLQVRKAEHQLELEHLAQALQAKDAEHSEKLQVQHAEHRLELEQALQEKHQQQTGQLEAKDAEHSEKLQVQHAEHRLELEQALQEKHQQQTGQLEAKDAEHSEKLQAQHAEHRLELEQALQAHALEKSETIQAFPLPPVDGKEIRLSLPTDASVQDLYRAVAAEVGLPLYHLKLIISGHSKPLPSADESLASFFQEAEKARDLLLVVSKGYQLGSAKVDGLEETFFQHHAVSAFGLSPGPGGLEECQGRKFTVRALSDTGHGAPDIEVLMPPYMVFKGVLFDQCAFTEREAEPLSGRVLLRAVMHQRSRSNALGIGVGTRALSVTQDPEYEDKFFGLYHGGSSINCCANATRYHFGDGDWESGEMLAILVDVETHTMQCFQGTCPFGPVTSLPDEPLWPVIVLQGVASPQRSRRESVTSPKVRESLPSAISPSIFETSDIELRELREERERAASAWAKKERELQEKLAEKEALVERREEQLQAERQQNQAGNVIFGWEELLAAQAARLGEQEQLKASTELDRDGAELQDLQQKLQEKDQQDEKEVRSSLAHQQELLRLQQRLADQEMEIDEQAKEITFRTRKLEELEVELGRWQTAAAAKEEAMKKMRAERDEASQEQLWTSREMQKLQAELQRKAEAAAKASALEAQLTELNGAAKELEETRVTLKLAVAEKETLQRQVDKAKKQLQQAEVQQRQSQGDLARQLQESSHKLQETRRALEAALDEKESLQNEVEAVRSQAEEAEVHLQESQVDLASQLQESSHKLQETRGALEAARDEKESLQNEVEAVRRQAEEAEVHLQESQGDLARQLQESSHKLQETRGALQAALDAKESLQNEVEAVRRQAEEAEVHLQESQGDLARQLQESSHKLQETRGALLAALDEKESLQNEVEAVRRQAEEAEVHLHESQGDLARQLQEGSHKLQETRGALEAALDEKESLQNEVEAVKRQAEEAEVHLQESQGDLARQLQESSHKLQETRGALQAALDAKESLQNEVEAVRRQAEEAEVHLQESQGDLARQLQESSHKLQETRGAWQSALDAKESLQNEVEAVRRQAEEAEVHSQESQGDLARQLQQRMHELEDSRKACEDAIQAKCALEQQLRAQELDSAACEAKEARLQLDAAELAEQVAALTARLDEEQAERIRQGARAEQLEVDLAAERQSRAEDQQQAAQLRGARSWRQVAEQYLQRAELQRQREALKQLAVMRRKACMDLKEGRAGPEADLSRCAQENEELLARNRELALSMQHFKQENDQLQIGNRSLLESVALFEADLEKVADRHAQLIGHVNKKQKIRYTVKLKEECAQLRLDLNKARHRLMQLEGTRRSDSLFGALSSLGYAPSMESSPQPKRHGTPEKQRRRLHENALERVSSDFRHLVCLVQQATGAEGSESFSELLQRLRDLGTGGGAASRGHEVVAMAPASLSCSFTPEPKLATPARDSPKPTALFLEDKENHSANKRDGLHAEARKAVKQINHAVSSVRSLYGQPVRDASSFLQVLQRKGSLDRKVITQGLKRLDVVLSQSQLDSLVDALEDGIPPELQI